MTRQEYDELEKRLETSKELESNIRRMEDALNRLNSNGIKYIAVPLCGSGSSLWYSTEIEPNGTPKGLSRVCWSGDEEGMADEIMAAVREIVRRRLEVHKEAYAKA